MRNKRTRVRFLALVAVMALIGAACTGDDATDTTEAAADTTEAAPDTTRRRRTRPRRRRTRRAASGEPIMIGILTDLTGFTPWAVNARDGMMLAAEEINAAGGVDGRMIELVVEDSANDADAGTSGYERLAEQGVVAIGGIISSTVGGTISPLAEELQIPTFLVKSGTEMALTADSRFMFRTCLPAAPMTAPPVIQYVEEQGLTNVGVIVADYPWGQSFRAAVEPALDAAGITYGETQVAPVPPDTDFTPFVRNIADAGAEMVIATGHPPGSAAIVTLSADLIGDVPVTGSWIPPDLAVGGLADLAIGRYVDFACADYTGESYAALAPRYLEFSDNVFMSDDAVAGHGIVTMVADAVASAGDDPVAISEYLHGQTYDDLEGYAHPVSWTEWGELASSAPTVNTISEGPAPEGLNEAGEWWVERLTQSETLEPYQPGS